MDLNIEIDNRLLIVTSGLTDSRLTCFSDSLTNCKHVMIVRLQMRKENGHSKVIAWLYPDADEEETINQVTDIFNESLHRN